MAGRKLTKWESRYGNRKRRALPMQKKNDKVTPQTPS